MYIPNWLNIVKLKHIDVVWGALINLVSVKIMCSRGEYQKILYTVTTTYMHFTQS